MPPKTIAIYVLGLISGVAVFGSAFSIHMAEYGFSLYYFALALFCALCVWVMDDEQRRLEDIIDELNEAITHEGTETIKP